jgi:chloramphenicol-sensitive protein RarD
MNPGILQAASAFLAWGLFPLYFKALREIAPMEILLYRVLWSALFIVLVLAWRRQWAWLKTAARQPRVLGSFAASAFLLSANWCIYIWAVNTDRVIDASLGYFINPLINVVLGFLLLQERMRPMQWSAVALAGAGVVWLGWQAGHAPWIGLGLGLSFGFYSLLRKTATLGALEGLALETLVLAPFAAAALGWMALHGGVGFMQMSSSTRWLLAASGPITAIPLLLFAAAARQLPLSLLGLMQYLVPSMQLLLGVLLFHEAFGVARLIGFALIWGGLALYTAHGLMRSRRG